MPELSLGEEGLAEVPRARHWVVRWCAEAGVEEDVLDVVELVTSELVANAYQHGRPPVHLALARTAHDAETTTGSVVCVELEVSDAGVGRTPVVRDADEEDLGGRGLALVDMLASAWGVRHSDDAGTTVWCRLAA
ncbi:ATP-binding protein [Pseudokineococcus sp. 1T1Z-3]|uniref:ATP-binding protein n=1 Tax=Pseudokineococcus sp. 1T1Z-3 TaxID=3132745 RepID=UPI003097BE71